MIEKTYFCAQKSTLFIAYCTTFCQKNSYSAEIVFGTVIAIINPLKNVV